MADSGLSDILKWMSKPLQVSTTHCMGMCMLTVTVKGPTCVSGMGQVSDNGQVCISDLTLRALITSSWSAPSPSLFMIVAAVDRHLERGCDPCKVTGDTTCLTLSAGTEAGTDTDPEHRKNYNSATFTSFGEYKHHMQVSQHIIRKPRIYECKTCGAMFINSGSLIVHLRSLNHEASELANYFQSSDFLVPDYLNQEQEETLVQYKLVEHSFENNSSVQMPVISQVSSTQNCESTFPLGSLRGLTEKEEEMPEQPKASASSETIRDDPPPKLELSSITIE
ncbi:uncharacterized protein LOC123253789 [Gracilinanus agilis]|uniref:uncharacterized protein LOC123253789 n=1 Tax=Gracilinanus agilis TaxID=191870 RepID=UPI001CFE5776|nr:uncharacterized protein LOC123253789 [Gracilinanus agilis]